MKIMSKSALYCAIVCTFLTVMVSSCDRHTCPTYSKAPVKVVDNKA
jgi:hypothetical protein